MLTIIVEVAARRINANKSDYTIQLSAFLMRKLIDEMNKLTNADFVYKDHAPNEIHHMFFDEIFIIRSREYRDDTNSQDVEEVLYEEAMTGSLRKEKPAKL